MYANQHVHAQNGIIVRTNQKATAVLVAPRGVTWKVLAPMCANRSIPRVCEQCGKSFLAVPYEVKIGRGRFCSLRCANQAKRPIRYCSVEGCERRNFGHGFCQMHYARWRRHGDPLVVDESRQPKPLRERLLGRINIDPNTGCWIWRGFRKPDGYARVGRNGKLVYVHVASYEEFVGPVPEGLELDHLCRNPSCLNPDHLEPVTHAENIRRGQAGENMRQKTHCPKGHPYSGDNLYIGGDGKRRCRACMSATKKRRRSVVP